MHEFVTGNWAGSAYDIRGRRVDHELFLSPDGSFTWSSGLPSGAPQVTAGRWRHDTEHDVLFLETGVGTSIGSEAWKIHYVSGCEDANTILVLRWVALASRNLPILFYRVHPPGDPVWRG